VSVRRGETTPEGGYVVERDLSAYTTVTVGPQFDRFTLDNLQPAMYYQAQLTASNQFGQSVPQLFIFKTADRKFTYVQKGAYTRVLYSTLFNST